MNRNGTLVATLPALFAVLSFARRGSRSARGRTPASSRVGERPIDGGSPRTVTNLRQTSTNHYRLAVEQSEKWDGLVLGQFMLEVSNNAASCQTVTLDLAGARTPTATFDPRRAVAATRGGCRRRIAAIVGSAGRHTNFGSSRGTPTANTSPTSTRCATAASRKKWRSPTRAGSSRSSAST